MKVVAPGAFFDAIARRYDRAYALGAAATKERMARVIAALPAAPATVLDLGVGTGRELGALQDAGYAPTGLDACEAMLAICARRARPVPLIRADFWERLPFEDGAFDAGVALHGTLAHPPGDGAYVGAYVDLSAEIARVLRPAGVFVAEVPSPGILAAGRGRSESGRVVPSADGAFRHEDEALGVAVEGVVLSEGEWKTAFGASLAVEVRPLSAVENVIVARRR